MRSMDYLRWVDSEFTFALYGYLADRSDDNDEDRQELI
jgi:hypothetical protein